MKEMSVTEAIKLVKSSGKAAISIYLKTDHHEPDGRAKIENNLKTLYQTVDEFISRTYDGRTKERLLCPLKRSIDTFKPVRRPGGIAIYHSQDFTGLVNIPTPTRDLAVAAGSYHLKPVMRCLQLRRKFYLLALRKNYAELFFVTPDGSELLDRVAMFARLGKSRVDFHRRLARHWSVEKAPLLIAGEEAYQEGFRQAGNDTHLLECRLKSPIDGLDHESLVGLANHFMEQHFAQSDELAVLNFERAKILGQTSLHLKAISQAAVQGGIKSLLVAEDQHLWGHLDRFSGRLQLIKQKTEARSDDVLDDIAELTLLRCGEVTVLPSLQMPEGAAIAATLHCSPSSTVIPAHHTFHPYSKFKSVQPLRQIPA